MLCNYLDSTWEGLTTSGLGKRGHGRREPPVFTLGKEQHSLCKQSLGPMDAISITTLYAKHAKPTACLLCLPYCRWPVSWSSSRAIWNVQRSGLSSLKGKQADCHHAGACRGAAEQVTKQHDPLAAAHLPHLGSRLLVCSVVMRLSRKHGTRRNRVGCL